VRAPSTVATALLIALAASVSNVHAQTGGRSAAVVLDLPASARASALGGAYAAVDGDEAALFYNPAQIATVTRAAGLSVERYLASSTLAALSAATRVGRGTAALGVQSLRFGSVPEIVPGTGGASDPGVPTGRMITAGDLAVSAGYAAPIGRVRVGIAGKYVQQSIAGTSGGTAAVDVGVSMGIAGRATAGLAVQHLGGDVRIAGVASPLPRRVRAGASLPLSLGGALDALVAADVGHVARDGLRVAGGTELTWRAAAGIALDARVGVGQRPDGSAASPLSLGGGVRVGRIALDYAYQSFDALGTTHRLGVRWR
jgi:hypothetical protein